MRPLKTLHPAATGNEQKKQSIPQQDIVYKAPALSPSVQGTETFDDFICNSKNDFPLAAAREVALGGVPKYNPFILCGKSGTGKTHILRALGNALITTHHSMGQSVFCGTAELFAEQLCLHGPLLLAEQHRGFVVDDIQRLAPAQPLQESIIRFLDVCLDGHCQLILASTKAPALLEGLVEGLRSRLEMGLVVELKEPDIDVRMRFALLRCRQHRLKLSRDHLLLLAQRCVKLRHLNGVILKVAAFQSLAQQDIDNADLENILRSSGEEKQLSSTEIIHIVADHLKISAEDILGSKRHPPTVRARQTAMFLCRDLLGLSYPALGKLFGGKDHSTVIHSIQKIKELTDRNKDAQSLVTELKRKCLAG